MQAYIIPPDDGLIASRKEREREYNRTYRAKHRERIIERQRQRRLANPEIEYAQQRRYKDTHRQILNDRAKAYRQAHIEEVRERQRLYRLANRSYWREGYRRERATVLAAYGGMCACCGETSQAFLCIDHVLNDGGEERRTEWASGAGLYRKLIKCGFPTDRYQLLCYNCNCAKQHDPVGHLEVHPGAAKLNGDPLYETRRAPTVAK
jgi:hypothetical protein